MTAPSVVRNLPKGSVAWRACRKRDGGFDRCSDARRGCWRGPGRGGQARRPRDKQALAAAQAYVGAWRGVGQPKRGSNQGAWTEESEWAWRFDAGRAELVCRTDARQILQPSRAAAGDAPGQFVLLATPTGKAPSDEAETPERFTGARVRRRAGAHGRRAAARAVRRGSPCGWWPAAIGCSCCTKSAEPSPETFSRLAEVGSTRKGSSFAKSGGQRARVRRHRRPGHDRRGARGQEVLRLLHRLPRSVPEDPAGVLAEYRERKAAEASRAARSNGR